MKEIADIKRYLGRRLYGNKSITKTFKLNDYANLFTLKILLIAILWMAWLTGNTAQPLSYLFVLNERYQLIRIIGVLDPFTVRGDTLWKEGAQSNPNTFLEFGKSISIQRNHIILPDKYNFLTDGNATDMDYSEYNSAFESINLIREWLIKNAGNKKGNYLDNWSKKEIRFINEFLLTPNKQITEEFANSDHLSDVDRSLIDDWLWFTKLKFNLFDTILLRSIYPIYNSNVDSISDLWISTALLPIMRLTNYKLLLRNRELIISIPQGLGYQNNKTSFLLYNYAALLYCLKKYRPHLLVKSESVNDDNTYPDTSILSLHNYPELNYVLDFYRNENLQLNLDFTILNQLLEYVNLKDTISSDIVVIEFWGTWCKPCLENMPELAVLASKYSSTVQFISIARDKREKWLKYLNSNQFDSMIHLLAESGLEQLYPPGVNVFPTYLIFNKNGELLYQPINYINELSQKLEKL